MPSLGSDMESATLVEWLVEPGDQVERNQVIAVVETTKGAIEIEIFEDAVIDDLIASLGEEVPVGDVIATYHRVGEAESDQTTEEESAAPPPRGEIAPEPETSQTPSERVKASPAARQRAREYGVDLEQLEGTGPKGSIVLADVERAKKPAEPIKEATGKAGGPQARPDMRRAIGAAMARSKREIPHYYLGTEIRLTRAMTWLAEENASRPVEERLIPAALLYRAVVLALGKVPMLNGSWVDEEAQLSEAIHLGVVISLRKRGLFAPALLHAERMSLMELMNALRDLTGRARAGKVRASELSKSTISVTNLGDRGVQSVYPVIYPPQLAIVGFGRITDRVVPEGDTIAIRPVIAATMAGDHRASDGYHGSALLNEIDKRLQSPEEL